MAEGAKCRPDRPGMPQSTNANCYTGKATRPRPVPEYSARARRTQTGQASARRELRVLRGGPGVGAPGLGAEQVVRCAEPSGDDRKGRRRAQ